ncbi:MAG: NADH-quinone oxidoreductase subunit A [Bacteroidota bacterium]
MLESYIPIMIMLGVGVLMALIFSNASMLFGPKRPTEEKYSTYESGMEPVGTTKERMSVKYYMVAMLFIVFDIEVIFLYPWAVNFRLLGLFGFVEMFIFILILLVGYYYILRKGALRWD